MKTRLTFFEVRRRPAFGGIILSQVAGRLFYCSPREDNFKWDWYSHVEIAIIRNCGKRSKRRLVHPSAVGIKGFDYLFEQGRNPVAGFVSKEDVERIEQALNQQFLNTLTHKRRIKLMRQIRRRDPDPRSLPAYRTEAY